MENRRDTYRKNLKVGNPCSTMITTCWNRVRLNGKTRGLRARRSFECAAHAPNKPTNPTPISVSPSPLAMSPSSNPTNDFIWNARAKWEKSHLRDGEYKRLKLKTSLFSIKLAKLPCIWVIWVIWYDSQTSSYYHFRWQQNNMAFPWEISSISNATLCIFHVIWNTDDLKMAANNCILLSTYWNLLGGFDMKCIWHLFI